MMANFCDISWTMIGQAAQGAGDGELLETVNACEGQTAKQIKWIQTRMKQAAPQTLLVAIFGLLDHPSVFEEGVSLMRVGAGALSVALTGAVLLLLCSTHPPTGATTLIVSLGLLQTPSGMLMLMVSVVLLTVPGWIIKRAFGVRMR